MKTTLFLLTLFLTAALNLSAQETPLTHTEFLVIDEESGDEPEYLFSGITIVRACKDAIYLADHSDNSIRVFNQKGEFIRKMGGRGRGPGEFQHLTDFNILGGELIAVDRFQNRIFFFDPDGNYTRSFVSEEMPKGVAIFIDRFDEENFLIGFRDVSNPDNEGYLLNLYNADFSQKTGQAVNVYNYFFDRNSRFILHYYGLFTDTEIHPYLNIYTASGEFLTTADLSDAGIPFIRENRFDISARHLDEENRVYYSVYGGGTEYPSLQVYELNLNDFIGE